MRTIGFWALAVICVASATLAMRQPTSIAAPPSPTAPATGPSTRTIAPASAAAATTRPAIPIRYDTTRILGPLKADGTVDYLAALNAQCSKGVTKENNAAILLLQAFDPSPVATSDMLLPSATRQEILRRLEITLPGKGEYFHDFLAATTRPWNGPDWKFHDKATTQPWKAEECPALAKWLKDNEAPLTKIVEASNRPRYYIPLVTAKPDDTLVALMLPSLAQHQRVARALAIRANLAAAEGRYEDAWNDVKAGYRLAALIGEGPTLIDRLVAIACTRIMDDVAANPTITAAIPRQTFKSMIKDILELPPTPTVVSAVDRAERYMFLDNCVVVSRDPHNFTGLVDLNPSVCVIDGMLSGEHEKGAGLWPAMPVKYEVWVGMMIEAMTWGNQHYDQLVEAMNAPVFADKVKSFKALDEKFREIGSSLEARKTDLASRDPVVRARYVKVAFCAMMLPNVGRAQMLADTIAMKRQLLAVFFALAAYNCDHKKYPGKLADLAPDYLKAIPADSFSGQPLLYKVHDGGCVVYSVGENMKDDGGKDKEHGGDDIVVTVGR